MDKSDESATRPKKKRNVTGCVPNAAIAATYRIEQHRLDELELHPELQVRIERDEDTIREYAEIMADDPDRFPPVDVFEVEGKLYLVDGWHRLNAAMTAKLDTIKCRVFTGTMEQAWEFAWGANKTNGRRLTTKDKRHAIEVALQRHPEWASPRIAALIGCTHPTVEAYRKILQVEPPEGRVGTDGKRRKVKAKHEKVANQVAKIANATSPPRLKIVTSEPEATHRKMKFLVAGPTPMTSPLEMRIVEPQPEPEPASDVVDQAVDAFDVIVKLYAAANDQGKAQIRDASVECVRLLFPSAELFDGGRNA